MNKVESYIPMKRHASINSRCSGTLYFLTLDDVTAINGVLVWLHRITRKIIFSLISDDRRGRVKAYRQDPHTDISIKMSRNCAMKKFLLCWAEKLFSW